MESKEKRPAGPTAEDVSINGKEELKRLRDLIRKGRLFDVQSWLGSAQLRSLDPEVQRRVMALSVETGFHSMVEALARSKPDQSAIDYAFCKAVLKKRVDIAMMLIELGANKWAVELESVAQCYDPDFMRFYFDHWIETNPRLGLFEIIAARAQSLIGAIRKFVPKIPGYERELAQALKYYVEKKDDKWVSLTLWLGANPRLAVPDPSWATDDAEDDPDEYTTAIEEAVSAGCLKVLKLLKPSKERDDLDALMFRFSPWRGNDIQVLEYLVSIGGSLNNLPSGGSSLLAAMLCKHGFTSDFRIGSDFTVLDIDRVQDYIRRGARFVPDGQFTLKRVREALYDLPSYAAEVLLKILAEAVRPDIIRKLSNTPSMKSHLAPERIESSKRPYSGTAPWRKRTW